MGDKKNQHTILRNIPSIEFPSQVPLIPIRDMVIFPNSIVPLVIGRPKSVEALDVSETFDGYVVVTAQKNAEKEEVRSRDLYRIGTLTRILQILRLPNNYLKVVIEGVARARITRIISSKQYFKVETETLPEETELPGDYQSEIKHILDLFKEYVKEHHELPEELHTHAEQMEDPLKVLNFIALNVEANVIQKQKILEENSYNKRMELIKGLLSTAVGHQNIKRELDQQVRDNMIRNQREYFLQEQLRVIKKELGTEEQTHPEIKKLEDAILAAQMPQHVFEKSIEELDKLKKTPPFSPEYTVTRNYLEWMIQLPWSKKTKDRVNVSEAKKILDEDHYGLQKPKERILEHLAVLQRVKKIKGPILCFVGPPGVGKTSLGKSIARALNRNFVRVSLGGVRDEAEIRGHRRTYIGSMPGKIIQSLKKTDSHNPVFLMDEVDKMSVDFRGDPSAALLEVLDPEQNVSFNDHYLDVDFDLSEVFFITTANVQSNIPPPLQDRMEIIELPGYLEHEKIRIAEQHLIPKQLEEHGLDYSNLTIGEEVLLRIIREYTREAGVRNLERYISNLCRKVTRKLVENKKVKEVQITPENLESFLGKPTYLMRQQELNNEVGVALGLAWTPYGGDILKIEVNTFPGKGRLSLTGKLGEVMKESAETALSYIRSIAGDLDIDEKVFQKRDIHVHVPEGAIPKDGPSAGITLSTAIISALTGKPVRGDVAMTGEITLRGKILAIGGFNEKMLAAQRNKVSTIIIPAENEKEVNDLPSELRSGIELIQVSDYKDILKTIFPNN